MPLRFGHKILDILDEVITETKTWKDVAIIAVLLGILLGVFGTGAAIYVAVTDREQLYELITATSPRLEKRIENTNVARLLESRLEQSPQVESYEVNIYYIERRIVRNILSVGNVQRPDELLIDNITTFAAHSSDTCVTGQSFNGNQVWSTSCPIISSEYGLEGFVVAYYRDTESIPPEDTVLFIEAFLREITRILQ